MHKGSFDRKRILPDINMSEEIDGILQNISDSAIGCRVQISLPKIKMSPEMDDIPGADLFIGSNVDLILFVLREKTAQGQDNKQNY
jgi:hypothetical protein